MLTYLGWALLALVFAALWVYAIYREDLRRPEPVWMLALATVAGLMAVPMADHLEQLLVPDLRMLDGSLGQRAYAALVVSGPVEEGMKMLAVLLIVWRRSDFDEPVDGIIYAAAAGAGFGFFENILFMQGAPEVVLVRGPIGTGAHVLFATMWGGALGHACHTPGLGRRVGIVLFGLGASALAHGTFNLITFSSGRELTENAARLLQVALVLAALLLLRWRLRVAHGQRPFRYRSSAAIRGAEGG